MQAAVRGLQNVPELRGAALQSMPLEGEWQVQMQDVHAGADRSVQQIKSWS